MPTLLVVDDSEIDRRLVIGLLKENSNWKIETAANGVEALARLKQAPVDLVLTDMQMPEMDGLELVKQIGIHHAQIPVILMTAHGSESLSIEALEQGAASYVPKSRLADILEESISQVLAVAESNRNYERLAACQKRAEFAFELDNDAELIDPLVDLIQQIAFRMGMCNTNGRFRIGMALQQTILNALYHGNLELTTEQMEAARESLLGNPTANMIEKRRTLPPYCDRKIHIDACITPERLEVTVKDDGKGFDVARAQAMLDGARSDLEGGRGLRLMKILMDEVNFNAAGNEVQLVKLREPAAAD
jgi:CheY-like chemotaxis protein